MYVTTALNFACSNDWKPNVNNEEWTGRVVERSMTKTTVLGSVAGSKSI